MSSRTPEQRARDAARARARYASMTPAQRSRKAERARARYAERTAAERVRDAERRSAYYEANRQSVSQRQRAYRIANAERIEEQARAYRQANAESVAEARRKWEEANGASRRMTRRAGRARRAGVDVRTITHRDLARLLGSPCLACGAPGPSTFDHAVPLSRGGRHSIGNALPLCAPCNAGKGARTWSEYRYADRLTARQVTA
jgi:5-methylcytosine-specific restriction endonuclease McrA